uniref:GIY-YIG homing endonuclease n=1 Tax=Panagrolaimus davidi TaxID=227884 RepID=A0A914PYR3_9BILA
MKINVQANLLYNEEYGGEYIELGKNLHKCKPKQYIPEELSPKIIYLPNFEERTVLNRSGLEMKILIIFDSNDKNFCYYYHFSKGFGHFVCNGCNNLKQHVSARLFTNESGEKYVQLSTSKQHICQQKKYEPQGFAGKVINAPYFELKSYLNRIKEKKQKLIVYSNEDKTLFYEYRFDTSAKTYLCVKCKGMKKNTLAKLKKYENGQDFVELGPKNHLCKPLKISR